MNPTTRLRMRTNYNSVADGENIAM